MAVVLPNALLTARIRAQHPMTRDARGRAVATSGDAWTEHGPWPCAITEPDGPQGPTGGPHRIRVDPRCPDLRELDELTDANGRKFIIREAKRVAVPGAPDVDFIRVQADLEPPRTL